MGVGEKVVVDVAIGANALVASAGSVDAEVLAG